MNHFQQRLKNIESLHQKILDSNIEKKIGDAIELIVDSLKLNLPMLVCGNGGSAADASHIAGELVGRFLKERKALNVICISANTSVITSWANDYEFNTIFSRQVEAHARAGGILLGLSTSGNSINVINAFKVAQKLGLTTIGMTGASGGELAKYSDVLIDVPSTSTPRIQEIHQIIYHFICEHVELRLI